MADGFHPMFTLLNSGNGRLAFAARQRKVPVSAANSVRQF
jgi:hypothetical protein